MQKMQSLIDNLSSVSSITGVAIIMIATGITPLG